MDLSLFISTSVLIFVAELPDKTAFATLFLATCQLAITAIGVAISFHMKHRINAQLLQIIAASAFGAVGIGILVKF